MFSAKATPLAAIEAYGQALPFRFTITNEGDTAVSLARVDAYTGHRWEMARGLGPLPPGGSLSFEIPYRVIDGEERLLLTLELPDTGRVTEAGAVAAIPCPPAPFDPGIRDLREESWTYSVALEGFVVRLSRTEYELRRKDELVPLPPLPYDFLLAVDLEPRGVKVLAERGEVREVRAAGLLEFLDGILRRHRSIVDSPEPDRAPFAVRE